MALTQSYVRELLDYEASSGVFRWKVSPRARVKVGDPAGCREARAIRVQIEGRRYLAHRLAWLWMTGEWPVDLIDHIDRNPHNNAWSNLRPATTPQNAANRTTRAGNKSGLKGAYKTAAGKFISTIKVDGRSRALGTFETAEAAHAAYFAAAQKYFGEYARAA